MRITRFFLPVIILLFSLESQSQQKGLNDAATIPFFYAFYGYQWPGADMAEQFGSNSVIGPGFMVKTKSNWLLGAEYDFHFGNNVINGLEIFDNMMTSDGQVISGNGTPALVALFERANSFGAKFGKVIPVSQDKNSGIFITAGIGYITHKIRIEVENQSAPQLKGDYKRGYDRLSSGLMLNQAIGFMYFGKSRLLNFTISVEAFEGFVKPQRDYYFDLMAPPPDNKQFDFLIGPKISWMIPVRQRGLKEFYYY